MNCVVVDGINYVITESMFISVFVSMVICLTIVIVSFVIGLCYRCYLKHKYPLDKVCNKDACDSK